MSRQQKKKNTKSKKSKKKTFILLVFSAIILCGLGVLVYNRYVKSTHPVRYSEYIDRYSELYGVPKDLIYATIAVESSFKEDATSEAGAIGLTQIMPDTLKWLQTKTGESYTEEDLKNPEIAIKYCAFFYSILLERFGNEDTAICAYHAGMNKVAAWLKNPEYSDDGVTLKTIPSSVTRHYLNKITRVRNVYNNLYKEEL